MKGRHQTRAASFAAGVLAAGFAPGEETKLPARARTREQRIAELEERERWDTLSQEARAELEFLRRKDLPNGAQLATWKQQDRERADAARQERAANAARRRSIWERWREFWTPKRSAPRKPSVSKAERARRCAAAGVPNTGRQWRMLRKAERRQAGVA